MGILFLIIGICLILLGVYFAISEIQKKNKKADTTISKDDIKPNKFELLDVLMYRYKNDESVFPFKIAVVKNTDDNKVYLIDQKQFSENLKLGCTWGSNFSYSMNNVSLSGDFKLYIKKDSVVVDPDKETKVTFNEKGTMMIKGYFKDRKINSENIYPAYKSGSYPYKENVTYYNCNPNFDTKLINDATFVDADLEFDVKEIEQ